MTRHSPPRLDDVRALLDRTEELAQKLRAELDDVSSIPYTKRPGPELVGKGSGHSDPTGEASVSNAHVKAHVRRGYVLILKAYETLSKAHSAFGDAVKAADAREDFERPVGSYDRPMPPDDVISKREHRHLLEQQKRRREA